LDTAPRKATLSDLAPADLRPWLDLPVSKLLQEHLQRERADALQIVADHVEQNEGHKAALARGWLSCIEDLWALLHPAEPAVTVEDEPFIDPATIREPQR
jgi:hypothetical protein